MKVTRISEIFEIKYGNQLDLNKLIEDKGGVSFVNRSSKNLGITSFVQKIEGLDPHNAGLLTVALGGSVLSAFVQPSEFYTGQNIKVLEPKLNMSLILKKYYCCAIKHNAFRYGTCGREANSTFDKIEVPCVEYAEKFIKTISPIKEPSKAPLHKENHFLIREKWCAFRISELFRIEKGKRLTKAQMTGGLTPFIGAIDSNNGIRQYVNVEPNHRGNTITVNYNGSVAEAFYQAVPYWASDDVNVLYPKFKLTPFNAMFLCSLIRKERFRFSYGRKWHLGRMNESIIKLPTKDGQPDFEFMENYIKSLPYSSNL